MPAYTGTGETTDRLLNFGGTTGGAVLDQSGSGLLRFSSTATVAATGVGVKTLTLQGSTAGSGEFDGLIADASPTTINTSVAQSSANTTLTFTSTTGVSVGDDVSGTSIYPGTTVTAVNSTTVTLSFKTSAIVPINTTITFQQTSISLTKQGTGTWTLGGANTYAGATTVSAGKLVLSSTAKIGTGVLNMNGGQLDLGGVK